MKDPLGFSPSKGNQGTTQGKEKILLTSVGVEPRTSGLDLLLLCIYMYPFLNMALYENEFETRQILHKMKWNQAEINFLEKKQIYLWMSKFFPQITLPVNLQKLSLWGFIEVSSL